MSLFSSDTNPNQKAVQSKGPAVFGIGGQTIGNIITKTNKLILDHRDFLATINESIDEPEVHTTSPPYSLITTAASLSRRAAYPAAQAPTAPGAILPECSGFVASASAAASNAGASSASALFSVSLSSVSSTASASITALQNQVNALNDQVTSLDGVLTQATSSIIAANSTASAQSSSASFAFSSASSAISSAQASAAAAIASAQSSASSFQASVQASANQVQSSASSAQLSADAAVASANGVASAASAAATVAVAQAQASVSSINSAAQQSITNNRIAAMNTTKFALAITFAILGSSIISIVIFYFIIRCRRKRREKRQNDLKEKLYMMPRTRGSGDSPTPREISLSEFPMPIQRTDWGAVAAANRRSRSNDRGGNARTRTFYDERRSSLIDEVPEMPTIMTNNSRKTWAPNQGPRDINSKRVSQIFTGDSRNGDLRRTWSGRGHSRTLTANTRDIDGNTRDGLSTGRPNLSRKNTLTYDPEHPERPPKFTTWLEESFRSVSPFPVMENIRASFTGRKPTDIIGQPRGPMTELEKIAEEEKAAKEREIQEWRAREAKDAEIRERVQRDFLREKELREQLQREQEVLNRIEMEQMEQLRRERESRMGGAGPRQSQMNLVGGVAANGKGAQSRPETRDSEWTTVRPESELGPLGMMKKRESELAQQRRKNTREDDEISEIGTAM